MDKRQREIESAHRRVIIKRLTFATKKASLAFVKLAKATGENFIINNTLKIKVNEIIPALPKSQFHVGVDLGVLEGSKTIEYTKKPDGSIEVLSVK